MADVVFFAAQLFRHAARKPREVFIFFGRQFGTVFRSALQTAGKPGVSSGRQVRTL
jgi:hypothetical protein